MIDYNLLLMDERRLEIFVAVAERLSFSAASRVLHVSQPAVSQQVAALERELGAQLFERSSRHVRLTAAGAALRGRAGGLLREHADARRAVAAAEGRIAGSLTVAASLTVGGYLLPPALVRLTHHHPELCVRVKIENTEQVVASLLEGRADVGFVEGELTAAGILVHPLREDELVIVVPPGHRLAADDEVALDDLIREPFVLREPGSGTRQVAESHLRAAGVDPTELRVAAELSSIDAIKTAVAAGLGVSIISLSALPNGAAAWQLAARRIRGLRLTRQMAAATLRNAPVLPATRSLLLELGR